jgi:chromosomal replication initiator protein
MNQLISPWLIPGLKRRKKLPDSSTLRQRIIDLVTKEFGILPDDVFKKCRKHEIVMSRHISMLLIRTHDPAVTLKNLGGYFGGKDHTTVMHSLKTIRNLMQTDDVLKDKVQKIQEMI